MTHNRPKIALYQPDIPQNTASIIRTCSCLGLMLEIIEPCGFIINERKFKRVVMDYYDAKNINFYKSPEKFFMSKINTRIILMTTKSKKSYEEFLFRQDDTVLFGRESLGVPTGVHNKVNHRLTIPMMNKKRSLNLSSSVSIVISKILNQDNF